MKKILLAITVLHLFNVSYSQVVALTAKQMVDLRDPLNIPYNVKGRELSTLILQGVNEGKINGYDPDLKTLVSPEMMERRRIANPSDDDFYFGSTALILFIDEKISVDTIKKERSSEIVSLSLVIPGENPHMYGYEKDVVSVKFTDLSKYLDTKKLMWYNPFNNADSMRLSEALGKRRFKAHSLSIENEDKSVIHIFKGSRVRRDGTTIEPAFLRSNYREKMLAGDYPALLPYFEDYYHDVDSADRVPSGLLVRPEVKSFFLKFNTLRWKYLDSTLSDNMFNLGRMVIDNLGEGNLKAYDPYSDKPIIRDDLLGSMVLFDGFTFQLINIEEDFVVTDNNKVKWIIKSIIFPMQGEDNGLDLQMIKIRYEDFLRWAPVNVSSELLKLIESTRYSGSIAVKNIFQEYIAVIRNEHCSIDGGNVSERGEHNELLYKNISFSDVYIKRDREDQLKYLYNFIFNVPPDKHISVKFLDQALLMPENIESLSMENLEKSENPFIGLSTLKNLKYIGFSKMLVKNPPADLPKLEKLKEVYVGSWDELDFEAFFSVLEKLKSLRILRIQDMDKTDFPGIIKVKNLEQLEIRSNKILNADKFFPQLAQLPELRILELKDCNLNKLPSSLGSFKKLEALNIRDNSILSLPKEMKKLKNLKKLVLTNGKFSEEEKARNKKLLPNVEIIYE
jgi:hypothetical protein